jgi:signal transduction histidine kinase
MNLTLFRKFTFAQQFLILSLVILVAGMLIIGFWIQTGIEEVVLNRTAAVTSLYVDSFVTPLLQDLDGEDHLDPAKISTLNHLLSGTSMGQQIVAYKVWSIDGRILFSPNPELIGQAFEPDDDLELAFQGIVNTNISDLSSPENYYESQRWDSLIETYAPIRLDGSGEILAVSEFYQTPEALQSEIRTTMIRSWLIVGIATIVMYLLLAGMVGRASNLITQQHSRLEDSVRKLKMSLDHNKLLTKRIRRAAAKATTLNEQFLHRISADLHDGPAQSMALALLRIETLAETVRNCPAINDPVEDDFNTVQNAIESSLMDLRSIAAGLRLPEVETLTLNQTIRTVVKDHERIAGRDVSLHIGQLPEATPLPIKITIYRLIQEALSNSSKHAPGVTLSVVVGQSNGGLKIEVADSGEGFDLNTIQQDNSLGLAGMNERVEVLGGRFEVESSPGEGTIIRAQIPLDVAEIEHD